MQHQLWICGGILAKPQRGSSPVVILMDERNLVVWEVVDTGCLVVIMSGGQRRLPHQIFSFMGLTVTLNHRWITSQLLPSQFYCSITSLACPAASTLLRSSHPLPFLSNNSPYCLYGTFCTFSSTIPLRTLPHYSIAATWCHPLSPLLLWACCHLRPSSSIFVIQVWWHPFHPHLLVAPLCLWRPPPTLPVCLATFAVVGETRNLSTCSHLLAVLSTLEVCRCLFRMIYDRYTIHTPIPSV